MGDRANFGVRQGEHTVYLYGHWAGYGMLAKLANALDVVNTAGRLRDESYATRIMFESIIGSEHGTALGWGITVDYLADNEHKVPVVDFREGTVSLYDYSYPEGISDEPIFTTGISNFVMRYAKPLTSV